MAAGELLNVRGTVESVATAISGLTAQYTIGMTRYWPQQEAFASGMAALVTEVVMGTVVFATIMTTILALLWTERKFFGRIMDRRGATTAFRSLWVGEGGDDATIRWWEDLPFGIGKPFGSVHGWLNKHYGNAHELETVNRVGNRSYHGAWWALPGMIQNVADGMKFMTKEHMVPEKADRFIFELAPVIIISTTVLVFAFIPLGPTLYAANSELSLLFMMAIFGIAPLGVFFAGWSSNNKYTLIGGMRSAAQLTAYEIPLLITVLAVAVLSGSFNLIEIVEFQAASSSGAVWNLFLMPLGAVLFLVTMIAEVERIPFDMPEAEAELVEGWWTEYGGMRWGLMFASEYLRAYAACLLFALMFLGGWEAPFEDVLIGLPMVGGLFGTIFYIIPHTGWLLIKSWLVFAGFVWVRSALHRVRTDQILEFGWRYLLPLSLLNLALAFWLRLAVFDDGPWPLMVPIFITTIAVVLFMILVMDEDEEALEAQRRPYSVQSTSVASPGAGKE
jgi:NADH:ubiquinone oxidoreductase subunit H